MKKISALSIVLIYAIIAVAVLGIMAFMVVGRVNTLTKESQKIVEMDLENGEIDNNIYSKGRYAVVESAIKNYINNYMNDLRRFTAVNHDPVTEAMLSSVNIQADGPDFENSKRHLENQRNTLLELKEDMIKMGTEENMIDYFNAKGQSFFFKWLYKNQMLDNITTDFFYDSQQIEDAYDQISANIDKTENVIDFLIKNKEKWSFEDGQISFENDKLLSDYNELIKELQ